MREIATDSIVIPPRQREPKVDEWFIKSVGNRLIQPIVLRETDEGPTLVVGARRLLAMKELKFDTLTEGEHFKFLSDLSPEEAKIVELEENMKREPMTWREQVKAYREIHDLLARTRDNWTQEKTANELAITTIWLNMNLAVSKSLDSPLLNNANDLKHAYSILQIAADRASASIIEQIKTDATKIFSQPESKQEPERNQTKPQSKLNGSEEPTKLLLETKPEGQTQPKPDPSPPPKDEFQPILCTTFQSWLETYSGPKFNLIHCDFPYNIEYHSYGQSITSTSQDYDTKPFNELLDLFVASLDKFCSYQAHIVFWFSMEFYEPTRIKLEEAGLTVHRHPLIWFKSDNAGIIPGRDNQYPRRVYETAFLCSRGNRPLVRSLANLYACPTASHSIHPSQKPESMLKHFFTMLIDQTTDVFDPTCGSGSALRAADSLNARTILGLEQSSEYAKNASLATIQARKMRNISL